MAEIKSTIELIMEKTKGLRLSDEEKQQMDRDKARQEAKGWCIKYLDGEISLDQLEQRLEKAGKDMDSTMMTAAIETLIEAIGLRQSNQMAIDALRSFATQKDHRIFQRISELISSYHKQKHKRARKIKLLLWQQLKEKGISGSSVEPNIEHNQQWQEALKELDAKFEERLQGLKRELRDLFEK